MIFSWNVQPYIPTENRGPYGKCVSFNANTSHDISDQISTVWAGMNGLWSLRDMDRYGSKYLPWSLLRWRSDPLLELIVECLRNTSAPVLSRNFRCENFVLYRGTFWIRLKISWTTFASASFRFWRKESHSVYNDQRYIIRFSNHHIWYSNTRFQRPILPNRSGNDAKYYCPSGLGCSPRRLSTSSYVYIQSYGW